MVFTVMNRQSAKKYSYQQHGHKYIIISINNMDEEANRFNRNNELIDVLSLFFDDVESGESNCIEKSDAIKIIEFINKHMDADECVVHCSAGVSRSAGICAALMLIVNGSDKDIFDNPKYCPNRTCYFMVLNTYFGSYDEAEIEAKYKHNIEIWKQHHLNED